MELSWHTMQVSNAFYIRLTYAYAVGWVHMHLLVVIGIAFNGLMICTHVYMGYLNPTFVLIA